MARHNDLGRHGEDQVACYLRERGFVILERNWRTGRLELDFVCMDGNVIVVVEVKTRYQKEEYPAELLDYRKRRNLQLAATAYITRHRLDLELRFDLVVVSGPEAKIEYYPEIIDLF